MNLRTEAEILAIGIEAGIVAVDEAIAWADAKLASSADFPCELVDVSMSSRAHPIDIVHALRLIPGHACVSTASRIVITRMNAELEAGRARPADVAHGLFQMFLRDHLPDAEAAMDMGRLDDAFGLAQLGYSTQESAEEELRDFLWGYRDKPADEVKGSR